MGRKGFIWVRVAQVEDHWWLFYRRDLDFGINKRGNFLSS
jgi:hypothetical protein